MLKFAALLTLVSAVLCASALMAAPARLHYVIMPEVTAGQMRHMRISFNMPTRAGRTYVVDVPQDLSSAASAKAFSIQGGDRVDEGQADAHKLVLKAISSRVTVSYRLGVAARAVGPVSTQRTGLSTDRFSMRGGDILLIPRGFDQRSATVGLRGVAGWTTASDLHGPAALSKLRDAHFSGAAAAG